MIDVSNYNKIHNILNIPNAIYVMHRGVNAMANIAIVGPGGAGKTTFIHRRWPNREVIHAVPITRKLSSKHGNSPIVEVIMGIERLLTSYKAKLKGNVVMDRCFICGEAYAEYWGVLKIARFFTKVIYRPKVIIMLVPDKVIAKRKFEQERHKQLTIAYVNALVRNDYKIRKHYQYGLGMVVVWHKS